METRPYNGAPSRRPLLSNCIFIFQSERSRPFPTIFHYSFFIIHPFSGRRGYGCAITPLSLRDISPNRGISPTPTHEMNAFTPTNPNLQYFRQDGVGQQKAVSGQGDAVFVRGHITALHKDLRFFAHFVGDFMSKPRLHLAFA